MSAGSSPEQKPSRRDLALKVLEARQKDVGRGKVRIDVEMLAQIDVSQETLWK